MSHEWRLAGPTLLAVLLVSCKALFGPFNNPYDPLNSSQSTTSSSSATPSYLYVTNDNSTNGVGGLSAYVIGSGGALSAITTGTFTTGSAGSPFGIAASPNGSYLYVTNGGTNSGAGGISAYSIGSGGSLTSLSSSPFATSSAGAPMDIAITPNGSYLYATNVASTNGAGGLSAYSIGTNGSLTALSASPFTTGSAGSPEFIAISPNGSYLYVTNYGSTSGAGGLSGYSIGAGGVLTSITGSPFATGSAGPPQGVAISPNGSYLYVTNHGSTNGSGGLSAYSIGAGGSLTPLSGSPYATGTAGAPELVTISPNGSYLYVTNSTSTAGAGGLSAYSVAADGALTSVSGSPFATGSTGGPASVSVSPDGSYVYVSNFNSSTGSAGLSAYLIGTGGTLTPITSAPFATGSDGGPAIIAITP